MNRSRVRSVARTTPLLCLLIVGCRSGKDAAEPPPVVAPALEYGSRQFVGSVLSGPSPSKALPADTTPEGAFAVTCRLTYHESLPRFELPPLGSQARLIGAMRGDETILPNPVFATHVQLANAEVASDILQQLQAATDKRSLLLHEYRSVLLPGISTVVAAQSVDALELSIEVEAQRRLAVAISRDLQDQLDLAIIIDQVSVQPQDETFEEATPGNDPALESYAPERDERILQREFVLLENAPTVEDGPILIIAPSPFPGDEGAGFSMLIDIAPAPDAEPEASAHVELVTNCLDMLRQEQAQALESARRLESSELRERQVAEALRNLRLDRLKRRTLLFLTSTTGAPLAEDLALIVSEEGLRSYAQAVIARADDDNAPISESGGLGWLLERGAYQFLSDALSEERIQPSHFGLLLKHAGEAGQFPAIIEDALSISRGLDDLHARFVEENRAFLEDHSVAARVRAYDWLDARGEAPEGYDPLDERDERRAALAADRERREAEAAARKAEGKQP